MPPTAQVDDTTRSTSPEGILRAGAVLTRSGPITYLRSEIGLDGEGSVTVERTLETLAHPRTLASLRGAPLTLLHPSESGEPDGVVTPDNARGLVVGAVAGEPRVTGDQIVADVTIWDAEALDALDTGTSELSVGYVFNLDENTMTTRGPMLINHVAMVPDGRAGPMVRVLDASPWQTNNTPVIRRRPSDSEPQGDKMDTQTIVDAVSAAFDAGMNRYRDAGDSAANDADAIKRSIMDALGDAIKPLTDAVTALSANQDAATKAATDARAADNETKRVADAKADAKAAADALVAATRAEERARYEILVDALPLIAEDKRAALADAEPKAILVAALGDAVPDGDKLSVDYLRGALRIAKAQADAAQMSSNDSRSGSGLPEGVSPFAADRAVNSTDVRTKAHDAFVDMQQKVYADAGGI